MFDYQGYPGLERGRECNRFEDKCQRVQSEWAVVQAVRMASCSTIKWRIGRDSPTGASKRTNGKLEPTLRVEAVEGSFPINSNSLLWSRDVGTDINGLSLVCKGSVSKVQHGWIWE